PSPGASARAATAPGGTTPGVALDTQELAALGLPENVSTAMFRSGVVESGPEDVRIVSDVANADGSHSVRASSRLDVSISETPFGGRPTEPLYGVLNRWEFSTSPLAVVDVTAAHNPLFTVGTLTLDTRATKTGDELTAFVQTAPYLAIAPAVYEFGYSDTLLEALPTTAPIAPASRTPITVDSEPTAVHEFGYSDTRLEAPPTTAPIAPASRPPITVDSEPTATFVERVQ